MTTSQTKTYFNLGSGKYECKCATCKIELSELKKEYPEGTPIPILCDKCKEQADYQEKIKIFNDRYDKFISEVPEAFKPYIKFELSLENYHKCKDWFNKKKDWAWIFYGTTGTGKTTKALTQLCKAYVFLGLKGEFIEAPRLGKRLRSDAMNGKNPEEQFRYFSNIKFLIIDDFLTESDDQRDKGLIESLFAEREKNFRKTIVTTNETPDSIFNDENGYSLRMKSRLEKIKKQCIQGMDFRKQ